MQELATNIATFLSDNSVDLAKDDIDSLRERARIKAKREHVRNLWPVLMVGFSR